MIDIENAIKEFKKYTSNYNCKEENIFRKVGHSLRVMDISKKLATQLKLVEEEVNLATLIGLLHDIGRFEQYKRFSTFRDVDSIDHGELGVSILKENNYIRKYIETDKYDNIIFKSIYNHNKYKIDENLNDEEELFSKIIRDSDKIDIIYEATCIFYVGQEDEISNSTIDEKIEEQVKNKKQILKEKGYVPKGINEVLVPISFIYDINFNKSFEILKKEKYIEKILERFNFTDKTTKEKIEVIKNEVNEYIESKI